MWTKRLLRWATRAPVRPHIDVGRILRIDARLDRVESDLRLLAEDVETILRRRRDRRNHGPH